MHDGNSSWRGRLPANAGTLGGALLACLCAGQLAASAPASSTAAAPTAQATAGYALTASVATIDPAVESATDARVAAARARVDAARATRAADRAKSLTASRLQSVARSQAASRSANRTTSTAERPTGTSRTTGTASKADRILAEARRHIGAPYEFGASGPEAFDCSGFTAYVFRKVAGIDLPHKADSQQHVGRAVSRSAARPGDLIVFQNGSYGYHVGIYAGSGYMYDSPRPGETVGRHKIWSGEYVMRRVLG